MGYEVIYVSGEAHDALKSTRYKGGKSMQDLASELILNGLEQRGFKSSQTVVEVKA